MITTAGQLLIQKNIPAKLRKDFIFPTSATKKTITSFFGELATKSPQDYKDTLQKLKVLGDDTATMEGSSFTLNDFVSPVDKDALFKPVFAKINKIRSSKKPLQEQEREIAAILGDKASELQKSVLGEALKRGGNLAQMISTGTRGKPPQLNMMIGAPTLFLDHQNSPITMPVTSSYAEGLKPHEYLVASYGARKGVLAEKFAIRDAGYLAKQLARASNALLVTVEDCGTDNGISESLDSKGVLGRYLARTEGPYPSKTLVTADVVSTLKNKGKTSVLVRSPLTCEADKGVCKYCTGITEKSKLPELGENVGLNAAASMSEPITQMTLRVKHSGGVSGGGGVGGFDLIKQLTTIPKTFTHGALLAETEGKVSRIEEAPQGGWYIHIGSNKQYVAPTLKILKKVGDAVEVGDELTDGVINPADVTRLKGVGAGRHYWARAMQKVFEDTGVDVWQPNYELVARAAVDHVQIQDPEGFAGTLPDDIVSYSTLQKGLKEVEKVKTIDVTAALGYHLGENRLQYTVGTPITSAVMDALLKAEMSTVKVLLEKPRFAPVMLSSSSVPSVKTDWLARMGATQLKTNLLKSIYRGATSSRHSLYPEPGLAYGLEFGRPAAGKITY